MFFRKTEEPEPAARKSAHPKLTFRAFVEAPEPTLKPISKSQEPGGSWAERSARLVDLKVRLHQRLLDAINLSAIEKLETSQFRREVGEIIREMIEQEPAPISDAEVPLLINDILDELLGLGPLEPLLKDPTVDDILVNTHSRVFVERGGLLSPTLVRFKDDDHLLRIIDKIVSRVGRRIDESQPMVDARLPDGSRVNAVIAPIAVDGPLLSIRKFSRIPFNLERLIEIGTITPEIAELLAGIVRCRLNVIISGGTGTGKTTFLNAISAFISHKERIVTIEDAAELQLQQPHVARLETRPANVEGKGAIVQRDLLKNALRMRPDRIILGEARGPEAFDMLQAMNTGHAGSITTIHANTPRDALSRLEQMIGMTGIDMPMRYMRSQIASAINVVIQLGRLSDGRRRLISLQEVTGTEGEIITMHEIFCFGQTGVAEDGTVLGHLEATGIRPHFFDTFTAHGLDIDASMFTVDGPGRAR
jgi:pilus assembly protein CpaF